MSRRERIALMRADGPLILPSMLLCDFGNLEREVRALEEAGFRALHLDVMDGNFVPNLSYGLPLVETFRRLTDLPLDVHLMIAQPGKYVRDFYEAGADVMSFHVEAVTDPRPLVEEIHSLGAAAGIVLNPETPVNPPAQGLEDCDVVLVMSVHAGFGGQAFIPDVLPKLEQIRQAAGKKVILEIDGGINAQTIGPSVEAGAQWIVVGSGIFRNGDYSQALQALNAHV